jgi:hypothetical protein
MAPVYKITTPSAASEGKSSFARAPFRKTTTRSAASEDGCSLAGSQTVAGSSALRNRVHGRQGAVRPVFKVNNAFGDGAWRARPTG